MHRLAPAVIAALFLWGCDSSGRQSREHDASRTHDHASAHDHRRPHDHDHAGSHGHSHPHDHGELHDHPHADSRAAHKDEPATHGDKAVDPHTIAYDSCLEAALRHGWCRHCNTGYIAGAAIKARILYDGLDAHGHDLDPSTIHCTKCRTAMGTDGFCETCRIGWINKQAYFSRLTYEVCRGRTVDVAAIACPACRENSKKYGWCETCGLGMVGNVAISKQDAFRHAARGYDIMLLAIEASGRCDACALAIITDTTCPQCRVTYKDGRPVPKPKS
jgi:hypothetical protein